MALILLHLFQRIDGRLDTLYRFIEADPAEITRCDNRQKIDADIGRRGPLGQDRCRIFLEVVRRQMMVFLIGELGEITPGPARITAQIRFVRRTRSPQTVLR
jgi:hypothetical protein